MYRPAEPKALAEIAAMGLKERSFYLTVGTVEPRKNHKVLVEAYVGLPPALRKRCPLVIVGASGWGSLDVPGQDELVREGSVRFLGMRPKMWCARSTRRRGRCFSRRYTKGSAIRN